MSSYHYLGAFAATTFMLTVLGLCYQLLLVRNRKALFFRNGLTDGSPTSILSLNQLHSIFLACYAFFIYGISTTPINHYLAWPRFMAMLILLLLFYQILIDRRNLWSKFTFYFSISLLILSVAVLCFKDDFIQYGRYGAQGLVIIATIILAQGYFHQVSLIRRSGTTGAVSIRFHQCVLLTAISTVAFGIAIGLKDGWPLVLLASVSASLKVITLWHFRWVRISKTAEARRAISREYIKK